MKFVSATRTSAIERYVLRDVLRHVSRSFYLTLAVLPSRVAKQVGLAYLFARAADTIADAGHMDRNARMALLQQFKLQFVRQRFDWDDIAAIRAMSGPQQQHPGERRLMQHLEDYFRIYEGFGLEDQEAIRRLLTILVSGMEMDLERFPGESDDRLTALPSMDDLDTYMYRVAGCVGEFWTQLMCAHLPSLHRTRDMESKVQAGVRFGKGLQLTNVLKDLPRDLRRGRCYIPLELLEQAGLAPVDLLDLRTMPQFSPVLHKLVGIALAHLDQGWWYTMSIPRREVRLRLACMWPILIALKTLRLLATCENVLDPDRELKISRGEVYRIMATTALTGGCGYVGMAYWGHVRKAIGQNGYSA